MINQPAKCLYLWFFVSVCALVVSGQRKVEELTMVYDAAISNGKSNAVNPVDGATATVFIKGMMSRSDMKSVYASSTSIHDARTGTSVILQEISGQKLLIKLNAAEWKEKNQRYDDIVFTNTGDTKTIAGYKCIKATATLKDGSDFTVYYTKDLIPANDSYSPEFRNLKGLPLEYELKQGNTLIRYTLSSISMNPVPGATFDIPKNGYRELTYQESKRLGTVR